MTYGWIDIDTVIVAQSIYYAADMLKDANATY